MKVKLIVFVLSIFSITTVFAQPQSSNREGQKSERKERVKQLKRDFIKAELQLSAAESTPFWSVYDQYELKREALKKERRAMRQKMKLRGSENLTEAEAEEILRNELLFKEKQLQLAKDYDKALKAVIPAVKILKLHRAERKFKRALLDRMKNRKSNKNPQHPRAVRGLNDED